MSKQPTDLDHYFMDFSVVYMICCVWKASTYTVHLTNTIQMTVMNHLNRCIHLCFIQLEYASILANH